MQTPNSYQLAGSPRGDHILSQLIRGAILALIIAALSFAQSLSISASSASAYVGHGDHDSQPCLVVCQSAPQQRAEESDLEDLEVDDKKQPVDNFGISLSKENMTSRLLTDGGIWRQSSWLPPDLLLESGAYSSYL